MPGTLSRCCRRNRPRVSITSAAATSRCCGLIIATVSPWRAFPVDLAKLGDVVEARLEGPAQPQRQRRLPATHAREEAVRGAILRTLACVRVVASRRSQGRA